MFEISMIS